MKKILSLFCVGAVVCAAAGNSSTNTCAKTGTASQDAVAAKMSKKEQSELRRYRHLGGTVVRKNSLSGVIYIVDCQKKADGNVIRESIDYLRTATHFAIELTEGKFEFPKPSLSGDLSLFVVDTPGYPSLLIAPENRWAMVNVSGLTSGRGESEPFFKARVQKEISRAFAGLCGAMSSQYNKSLTGGVFKVDDLDKHSDNRLSIDVISRFEQYLSPICVRPAAFTSYRQACIEGWAAAPTNDVQKAIWDEIHEIPSEPITIKKK